MDVEKRSIAGSVRNLLVIFWIIMSTIVYGLLCVIVAPLNKKLSRYLCILWNHHLLFWAGIKVHANGRAAIDGNQRYVFVANHQSHIDIPVIYKALGRPLSFMAKKELFQIPVFGWALRACGHIYIDRTNARKAHASIIKAVDRLQTDNISLVLFPEGTRSTDGAIGQLKQGSFSLVQKAGVEVVPIVIHDTFRIIKKYSNKITPGTVHVTIGTPFTVPPELSKAEISTMVREKMVTVLEQGPIVS